MTAQNNLSPNNGNGGVTAKSLSVPQIDPIFSYPIGGGDIYIYVFRSEVSLVMVVAFDDTSTEEVWSAGEVRSLSDVVGILKIAEIDFPDDDDDGSNPFEMLNKDAEALRKLYRVISQLLNGE